MPADRKGEIKFNFPGGELAQPQIDKWANGKSISLANPSTEKGLVPLRLYIPELGNLIITASPEYRRIWVWSLKDMDFVCIEPVMRDYGGLVNNPELIQPGETFSPEIKIELQE